MPETTTEWPYDARRDDPLTDLRIPVTTSHPQWYYTIAFAGRSDDLFDDDKNDRPDEVETEQLASYLEFLLSNLFESYRARLRERPFDIGVNNATRVFRKWGPDDWSYRLSSWHLPPYSPPAPSSRGSGTPLSLAQVLDRAEYSDGRNGSRSKPWLAWKSAHPEVFGDA